MNNLLIPLVTAILLYYADLRSRKSLRKNRDGRFVLRLNSLYKWMGFVTMLISSFLIGLAFEYWNEDIQFLAPIAIAMFLIMSIYLLSWYYNYEVVFDESRIRATTWKTRRKTINWNEVVKVRFNPILGSLKLYTNKERLVVLQHSTGFIEFLRMMESKTNYSAAGLKIPVEIRN